MCRAGWASMLPGLQPPQEALPSGPGPPPALCSVAGETAESEARGPVSSPGLRPLSPASCEHFALPMGGEQLSLHESLPRAPGLLGGVLSVVGICVRLTQCKRVFIYIYGPGWQCWSSPLPLACMCPGGWALRNLCFSTLQGFSASHRS